MTYNATALGTDTAPTREEIEEAVLEFDDANNGWSASVDFYSDGYVIWIKDERGIIVHDFDRLYEFKAWAFQQEKLLDVMEAAFGAEVMSAV